MKTTLLGLIKKCSFSIGDLNGKFGLSFWAATAFTVRLKIGKYRFGCGSWSPDRSDPNIYKYVNVVGWETHHYIKVCENPTIWKASWATYYGYNFGLPWFFDYSCNEFVSAGSVAGDDVLMVNSRRKRFTRRYQADFKPVDEDLYLKCFTEGFRREPGDGNPNVIDTSDPNERILRRIAPWFYKEEDEIKKD